MLGGASIPPDVPEAGPAEPAEPAEASVRHNDWPERDVVGGVDDDEAYDTLWHQGGQSSHDRVCDPCQFAFACVILVVVPLIPPSHS